jgi:phage-related protein
LEREKIYIVTYIYERYRKTPQREVERAKSNLKDFVERND